MKFSMTSLGLLIKIQEVKIMKEQIEIRIKELKTELESGQKMLEELDIKRANLGNTLLRISGAIQALQEMMPQEEETTAS